MLRSGCDRLTPRAVFQWAAMNPTDGSIPVAPGLARLLTFTFAYMAGAIAGALISGNREFVFYIVVMVVLISVVFVVHRRMTLTSGQLWALSFWGLLHMMGGLVPVPPSWPIDGDIRVLYSLWLIPDLLKYDQIVHAYGFGITTWICWHAIHSTLREQDGTAPRPTLGLLVLSAAGGMGFGALNEVIEFAAVLTIPNTNVGGYENTGWDLVSNLVGCITAALIIRRGAGR